MVQGTASDVGKSMLCTALCRLFADDGWRVAPFKSQNMALNSYVTADGGEIGRAQGVQAEAARVSPTTDMNPILLKPKQDMVAEVIVHGKHYADLDAKDYRERYVEQAMPIVTASLRRLQQAYDIIVIEGAGSPAEINLRDRDIANMRMADLADAAVILVADIERGGVFSSIVGTLELLTPDERRRVEGIVINKFRGRRDLLDDGIRWLEERTGIPVLGVLPYLEVEIEAEDSLALSALRLKRPKTGEFPIDAAVIRLPRISNFTDVDPLFDEPGVGIRYVQSPAELGTPDLLILPGTKNTMDDLNWLRRAGFEPLIRDLRRGGTQIVGICGGFQMLGERLLDPDGIEDTGGEAHGLGLLPVETVFLPGKQTRHISGQLLDWPDVAEPLTGYEIHLGRTRLCRDGAVPFLLLKDGREDGAVSRDGRVIGTYLHGLFHNRLFTRALCNRIRRRKGLTPLGDEVVSDSIRRETAYDRLAAHVRQHLDLAAIYRMLNLSGGVSGR